jgi:menaquinone-dependent protoporphyrinogen oxidase
MKFLIIYGTTEGQTKKIAERAGERISQEGHEVEIVNSESLEVLPNLASIDGVILASSIHQERHQDSVINLVLAHRSQLETRPTAFISVSLSAATPDGRAMAQQYLDRFTWVTKFEPTKTLLLAGALRFSEYDYFKVEIVKHIVSKTAGVFDQTGDHEFTDWNALAEFIDGFVAETASRAKPAANTGKS